MTPGVFACCGLVGGMLMCAGACTNFGRERLSRFATWGNGFLRRSLPKFMHISSRVAGLVAR